MRQIQKKTRKRKRMIIALATLTPLLIFGLYLGTFLYMLQDLASFVYDLKPQTADMTALTDISLPQLRSLANQYEDRLERYHIPINLSIMVRFNLDGQPIRYDDPDNAGLWTGIALGSECFRYASIPNGTEDKENSRRIVYKLLSGLTRLIEVPNGGLGPDYPSLIARFYVSPDLISDGNYTWMFTDYYKHFNGSGPFSDWRVRLYTSKDELGGYFLGIAAALRLVRDDPWVQARVKLIVGQIVEGFLDTFWQEMHGDGTPNGAHLHPLFGQGTEWKLLVLKMGMLCYPENQRYAQLYHYYAEKSFYLCTTPMLSDSGCIDAYYQYGFAHHTILALMLVEDNQKLLDLYIKNYESSYKIFQGHRNAYFNAIFLVMNRLRSTATSYNLTQIRWDILDQLWRFQTSSWFPMDDSYGGRNRSVSRADLDPLGLNWTLIEPKVKEWRTFVYETPLGSTYQWVTDSVMRGILNERYRLPSRADMFHVSDFIWGDDPFDHAGGHARSSSKSTWESPGTSFTFPYWILTYYGYLEV